MRRTNRPSSASPQKIRGRRHPRACDLYLWRSKGQTEPNPHLVQGVGGREISARAPPASATPPTPISSPRLAPADSPPRKHPWPPRNRRWSPSSALRPPIRARTPPHLGLSLAPRPRPEAPSAVPPQVQNASGWALTSLARGRRPRLVRWLARHPLCRSARLGKRPRYLNNARRSW
jgi:hypothetical protein